MKRKICILLVSVLFLGICTQAFSRDRDEIFVREEAARRNVKLLSEENVRNIVAKRFDSGKVFFKEIELDNEFDDYPNGTNFRPVWQVECVSNGSEYDVDVDAVSGEILKFKLDD